MEFWEWITKKYVDWRGDAIGKDRSISDFARYMGVSQSVMSSWMQRGGRVPRYNESIGKLVKIFGFEVYDALGMPRPVEMTLDHLPEEFRKRLNKAIDETNAALRRVNLDVDSPEFEKIAIEIFERHGFKYSHTETE